MPEKLVVLQFDHGAPSRRYRHLGTPAVAKYGFGHRPDADG